jgi:two-component system phosphate regulon sensor histidine kinase PhoR
MKHVDRVLLFASIRSGKDRYNLRPIEISEILRSVLNDTSALVREEGCLIEEHVAPAVSRVLGDSFAIGGCLENLITNAVKYSGGDRRIHISTVMDWTPSRGYEVAISVEDHGMGIKDSELKNIFEPFYRSPEAAAAQIHGTGLGLSLAKHLAEATNGRLSVVSQLGVGSIFTLHLLPAPAETPHLTGVIPIRIEGERNE